MTDELWKEFLMTGKIADYLRYTTEQGSGES